MEIKTTRQIIMLKSKHLDDRWVKVDDVKKQVNILRELIDSMKVRGMYMNDYSLIEYSQVMVNIDTAFKELDRSWKHERPT